MYINEYYQAGNAQSVDCTVGLRSKRDAARHGHKVCRDKGYTAFWVLHKPNRAGVTPRKAEYHPNTYRCMICIPAGDGPPYDAATATGMYDRY